MNSGNLIGDVVGVIIEKILMGIGVTTHSKMAEILGHHGMTFSDCYRKPDVLNAALQKIFGNAYLCTVGKIRDELMGLDDEKIRVFVELIGKKN